MARIDFTDYTAPTGVGPTTANQSQSDHAKALAELIESIAGAHVTVSPQTINGDLVGYASQLRAQMCTIYRLAAMLNEGLKDKERNHD